MATRREKYFFIISILLFLFLSAKSIPNVSTTIGNPPFANANYAVNVSFQYNENLVTTGFKNTRTASFCRIGACETGTHVLSYLCIGIG